MGTDIHIVVEKRIGVWRRQDLHLWNVRNYATFAVLASVRNGFGFAGIKTGDGYVPISMPRGLPQDRDQSMADGEHPDDYEDRYGDHSFSWLTLRELLDFDWTRTTENYGVVTLAEYVRWRRWDKGHGIAPKSYCGDIMGHGIVTVDESHADLILDGIPSESWTCDDHIEAASPKTYVRVSWVTPYARACADWWYEAMPALLHLAQGHYDDVRIVFGFDS